MKTPPSEASSSPEVHSENIRRELTRLIEHLEADAGRVRDPRFRALVGKAGEVLTGLRKLFERFTPSEPAAKPAERASKAKGATSAPDRTTKSTPPAASSAAPVKPVPPSAKTTTAKVPAAKATNGADGKEAKPNAPAPAPAPAPTTLTAVPPVSLPVVPPKPPEDPDAIAARLKLQRQEARAPKRPGVQVAPKTTPAPSGKPIWSQPHSS
ncbi:hypothetical protein [Horticoccus sp. 23ND18S-11]|uniref:hypothetical protein n=1 Tax=Horticoccus sp. 23ND18S-11 TaxID=3391832 RepID=UPI0039C9B4A5